MRVLPFRQAGPSGLRQPGAWTAVLLAAVLALAWPGAAALNQPPILALGADPVASGHGGPVVLPAWASLDPGSPDESSQTLSAEVEVQDPGLFDVLPALAPNGTLSFTPHPGAKGTMQATAVLRDDGDGDNTTSQPFSITITDDAPLADFMAPLGPLPHAEVQFIDASEDDGVLSWSWDFGDDGTSEEQSPAHAFERSGAYLVQLDVVDDAGQSSYAETLVVVEPFPLAAGFDAARRVETHTPITFESMSVGGEGPLLAAWDFGDGETAVGTLVQHVFLEEGDYEVRLDVSDGTSQSSATALVIAISLDGGLKETSPGHPVHYFAGDADVSVLPREGTSGGVVDYTFVLTSSLVGLVTDGIPAVAAGSPVYTPLLYLEGVPGPAHEPDKVGQVQITFHYDGLGYAGAFLQPWYWTGAGWVAIPRPATPYTVPCICPEGDQTFYGYTFDTGAQTLTVTAAHASIFGLSGVTPVGGGGGTDPPAPPAILPTPLDATPSTPTDAVGPAPTDSTGDGAGSSPDAGGDLVATLADGAPLAAGESTSQVVSLAWKGADTGVHFFLVAPDGQRHPLPDARWDPADWPPGTYRLEAVGQDGATLDTLTVTAAVMPVPSDAKSVGTALAAAATAMAVLAGSSVLAAAGISLATAASQAASETAASMAEERFYESRLARAISRLRRLRLGPAAAVLTALGLVTLLFAWAAAGSWGGLPSFLLTVGLPSVVMFACCYALDWGVARSCGVPARLRLLGPGALALAVSTLGFRTPIGNPALVDGDEPEPEEDRAGWRPGDVARSCASLLGYLAYAAPLWVAGLWLGPEVAAVGNAAIISILATGTLPVSPMTGSSLWHWRKSVALATWLGALGLYVGYSIGAVDDTAIAWLGLAALVPFTGLLVAFAVARRTPVPGWSAALGRAFVASARGGLWLIPAPIRRVSGRLGGAWDRMQERASEALRRAVWRLMLRPAPADA